MKKITVPKNIEAVKLLDINQCPKALLEEISLSQSQLDELFTSGIFTKINEACKTMIDDYEYEEISELVSIQIALDVINNHEYKEEITPLIIFLKEMFLKAQEYQTGVYFFF